MLNSKMLWPVLVLQATPGAHYHTGHGSSARPLSALHLPIGKSKPV